MDFDTILLEATEMMDKALKHTVHEFANVHTGKATPAMVEHLQVDVEAYGTSMPIKELGAITCPDNRTLQITPWDRNTAGPIDKAIRSSGLGLNPISRGATILVPVPELSGDRRRELVKVASGHAEDGRISIRQARQQAMEALKELKNDGHVSEDDVKRYEEMVQEETDAHIKKINEALKAKEADLLAV
ncbi:MAG: ribosome recycling factor [Opitutales bacterium]|nr:ribosome recycling factor [Opitutales bacterium]